MIVGLCFKLFKIRLINLLSLMTIILYMKQFSTLFLFICGFLLSYAQSLEWHKVFEDHSFGASSPISPSAVHDDENSVFVSVVENDTLKIYKYLVDGSPNGILNTEKRLDEYTSIIYLENGEFAIAFRENIQNDKVHLLQFDSSLNISRFAQLDFPVFTFFPGINHLIENDNQLYITLFDGGEHQLYKINADNSTTHLYSGDVDITFGENFILTENGNIIFSYLKSNFHLVRCVSLADGSIVWEHKSQLQEWQLGDYEIFDIEGELVKVSLDIIWEDTVQIGTIRIIRINKLTGFEISESVLFPDQECAYQFEDLMYNDQTGNLYLAYYSVCNDWEMSLLEFDPLSGDPIQSVLFHTEHDELNIGSQAEIFNLENGKIGFIYKSYVDEIEHGNLFVVRLNSDLSVDNTLEINLNPPNGSEAITHLLPIENSKFLLSGVVPDNDPFIFWEQVKYYTMMIDMEGEMSTEELVNSNNKLTIYPNPASQSVNIHIPQPGFGSLNVYDFSGKIIYRKLGYLGSLFQLNLKSIPTGTYILRISIDNKNYQGRLLVD